MRRASRAGISLVEMMVVIAIILLVCTLAFPAIQSARDASRRMQCSNNLWQIGRAMSQYESAFRVFPPASLGCDGTCSDYPNGKPSLCRVCPNSHDDTLETDSTRTVASAFVLILPYVEQQSLYNLASMETTGLWRVPRFHSELTSTWQTPQALQFISSRPSMYVCPSDPSEPLFPDGAAIFDARAAPATGSYAVCGGTKGINPRRRRTAIKCNNNGMFLMAQPRAVVDVTDGLSNTFLVGEVLAADTSAGQNIWSLASRSVSAWRTVENPLNTAPAVGRLPYPGVICDPANTPDCQNGAFGSNHFWGANFLYADGHVTYVRDKIDLAVYKAFATIAGGELISGKPTDIKK